MPTLSRPPTAKSTPKKKRAFGDANFHRHLGEVWANLGNLRTWSLGRIFMWGLILVDVDSCLRETNLGSKWTSSWVVFVVNCLQISWLQPFCNPHLLVNGCHGGTPLETSMEPTSLQMWISPHFYRWYTLKLVQISSPHWVFTHHGSDTRSDPRCICHFDLLQSMVQGEVAVMRMEQRNDQGQNTWDEKNHWMCTSCIHSSALWNQSQQLWDRTRCIF